MSASTLYRLQAPPEAARRLLLSYLEKVNVLAKTPEFYNTVADNCTSNVISRIAAMLSAQVRNVTRRAK